MSEEEIIDTLKILIGISEFNRLNYKENKAIQGLLDLYNKEKEQNLVLTKQLNSVFDRGYIHKDKIKEKIEWLDKLELLGKEDYSRMKFATDILKNLLKEEQ